MYVLVRNPGKEIYGRYYIIKTIKYSNTELNKKVLNNRMKKEDLETFYQ